MAVNKTLNIGKFRQKFQHVFNKDINNFYPMHMAKGKQFTKLQNLIVPIKDLVKTGFLVCSENVSDNKLIS